MSHEHNEEHRCEMCSGKSFNEVEKDMMDRIIKHGHQVTIVFPTKESIADGSMDYAFAYTIGRTMKDRPELLVTGSLPPEALGMILNETARVDDERPISAGDSVDEVLDGYPVRIVRVTDPKTAGMTMALHYMGDDIDALQVLWPDSAGRFPGEPGFVYGDDAEPVFGAA